MILVVTSANHTSRYFNEVRVHKGIKKFKSPIITHECSKDSVKFLSHCISIFTVNTGTYIKKQVNKYTSLLSHFARASFFMNHPIHENNNAANA